VDAAADLPFDPGRSWILGGQRTVAVVLAVLATVAFVFAAGGYLWDASWWPATTIGAAAVSLALMILFFTPWWLIGIGLSAGVGLYAWQALP
jgi:hypothetical protein